MLSTDAFARDGDKAGTAALAGDSVYNLSGRWKGVDGRDFPLTALKGKPVVLTLAYTACKASCPLIISKLKDIEAQSGPSADRVSIVVASFDPVGDTPKRLAEFAAQRKLDPRRWIFLSPSSDRDVRELAAVLGISYSVDAEGEISHSNAIVLLDAGGVIASKVNGLASSHEDFVKRLKKETAP